MGVAAGALSAMCYGMNPLGSLDPLTAVAVGIAVFGEAFSLRLAVGVVLILAGVFLVARRKR